MRKRNIIIFSVLIVTVIIVMSLMKYCNKPIPYVPVVIGKEMAIKDSFRIVIKYQDSTRLHHVTNWHNRTRITDSVPCYTEVRYVTALCDTVIKYDSIVIMSLKGEVKNDSVIIYKLIDKVLSDSITIKKLNKKLKRQKLITKLAFGFSAILGGAGGYSVKP